ncbi:MAG: lysine--tRNA ligase [Chlamydiales bacterium]
MTQSKPEYSELEEFQLRSSKIKDLRELGIDPFPHGYKQTESAKELHAKFENAEIGFSEDAENGTTPGACLSGRLVLFRAMGKNAFGHIQDHTGRIQIMMNRDHTALEGYMQDDPKPIKIIDKKIDLGDIIGVEGHLFHTHKGELTLYVKKLTLLCKTLLPLADKHSGLADIETRYRKRWLDLISNPEVQDVFRKRSRIISFIRDFLDQQGFLEVETPVLQSIYGGADARPFLTKLNALHQEMFMRISLEIPLKKLIIGGMDKVYEIGRVFRNEGIDRNHNPEFTLLEAYAANWDYNDMMLLMEQLLEKLAIMLYGTTKIVSKAAEGKEVILDVKAPWPRLTVKEAIKQYGSMDVEQMSDDEMKTFLLRSGHVAPEKLPTMNRGLLIGAIFEVVAEPHLVQPHHITDHPIETTPFCKLHRDPKKREEGLVERFESFILGHEICNAYTELNDPHKQRELLEIQAARREAGDEEASPLDEEFIEAICQGMPPSGGIGIGIDRLVMILLNSHSIRDVLYFPWMKPKEEYSIEKEV